MTFCSQLSAVTLKGYPLDKLTLKDRKMIKQLSTENVIQPTGNFYVSKPTDPSIRDEPDPIPPRQPTPPTSRRQSQTSIGRSQSVRVDRKPSLMQVVHLSVFVFRGVLYSVCVH